MYEILRLLECLESSIIAILQRHNQFSAVREWLRDGCGAGKGLAIEPLFSGLSTPMFAGRPYLAVDFFFVSIALLAPSSDPSSGGRRSSG